VTMTTETAMFEDVRPGNSPLEDGRYILKIVKLEPAEGQFGPQIKWYFNVADAASKAIIRDSQGEPYEWFGYTSTKTNPGTKTHTWASAFMGRELEIGESGSQLARDLLGKKAIAMVGPSGPNQRTSILSIKPFVATAAAPPPPPVTDDLDEL
jgi:hypothetical protein